MEWVYVSDKLPTEDGFYVVLIDGDEERDECGGLISSYEPYPDLARLEIDEDGGITVFRCEVTWEFILAWYGPIPNPPVS